MYVLAVLAVVTGGVAAAIPLKEVHDVGVFFGPPAKLLGPRSVLTFRVGEHKVAVHPPEGYRVMQLGEGDPSHAHVTLVPVDGDGGRAIVIRFAVPSGLDSGNRIGERDGQPVYAGPFGVQWRGPDGFQLLVSGDGVEQGVLAEVLQTTEVT